jgi:hypothetical protein
MKDVQQCMQQFRNKEVPFCIRAKSASSSYRYV